MNSFTRASAADALKEVTETETLQDRNLQTYTIVVENPGLTANEIHQRITERFDHQIPLSSITNRFAPLCRSGCVKKGDKKICSISGKNIATYVPTNLFPDVSKMPPPPSARKLTKRIALLEAALVDSYAALHTLRPDGTDEEASRCMTRIEQLIPDVQTRIGPVKSGEEGVRA